MELYRRVSDRQIAWEAWWAVLYRWVTGKSWMFSAIHGTNQCFAMCQPLSNAGVLSVWVWNRRHKPCCACVTVWREMLVTEVEQRRRQVLINGSNLSARVFWRLMLNYQPALAKSCLFTTTKGVKLEPNGLEHKTRQTLNVTVAG
jgi:hypothetical protein